MTITFYLKVRVFVNGSSEETSENFREDSVNLERVSERDS